MAKLKLSGVLSKTSRTEPLLSGAVEPEGIELQVSGVHPSEMFWRQLKFKEFDVSEMSLSSLIIAASKGIRDWVAIPVFTTREFFHTGIVVRADSGIEKPEDLVGCRLGVPEYQQTAAVWTRGYLLHEHGVRPQDMTWFMERPPEMSHGGATGFTPPPGVELSYMDRSTDMGEMFAKGELDAAVRYIPHNNLVDRSRRSEGAVNIRRMFPDQNAESARYFAKTGVLPVNHTVVVRASVLEESPWVALNLYAAFVEAKKRAYEDAYRDLMLWRQIGVLPAAAAIETTDPLPYGFTGQNGVLDTLSDYMFEQGLTPSRPDIRSLFAPSTLDL